MKTKSQVPPVPDVAPQPGIAIAAEQLFRGAETVVIVHNGERYQLRITRNKRLILTK